MARRAKQKNSNQGLGYEAQLWEMADELRPSMNTAPCQHAVLGLVFLNEVYVSTPGDRIGAQVVR